MQKILNKRSLTPPTPLWNSDVTQNVSLRSFQHFPEFHKLRLHQLYDVLMVRVAAGEKLGKQQTAKTTVGAALKALYLKKQILTPSPSKK